MKMATLTTVLVGLGHGATLIYGSQGSDAGLIQVINLDTENTVYVGNASNIMIGQSGVFPLTPGSSMSFSGSIALYGSTASGITVEVGIVPGGGNYSSGTVNISGPVTAEISGPVTVEGSIDIGNTPTVDLAAGATVDIGGIADVNIQNANVDVIGAGGYISPGQVSNVYTLPGAGVSAGPNSSTQLGSWNVSTYASVVFGQSGTADSSVAAGAAICSVWVLTWQDTLNNVIATDVLSSIIGGVGIWEIPVRGAVLSVSLHNPGTVGTVSNTTAGAIYVDGSYRVIPNIRSSNNLTVTGVAPVISGFTVLQGIQPVGSVNGWVANIVESFPAVAASYAALLGQWSGEVTGVYWLTSTNLTAIPTIVDLTYAVQGGLAVGNLYPGGVIWQSTATAGAAAAPISMNLPPTQCAVIFETPATAGHLLLSLIGVPN